MAEINNAYPPFRDPYKSVGRPLHHTPEELAGEFAKYVEWCRENPIEIKRTTRGRTGETPFDREEVEKKPRLVSIGGFLVWLGEDDVWWSQLENGKHGAEFSRVKARVRVYCEEYQKAMASSGVFKENIISRLLGLADKQQQQLSGTGKIEVVVADKETADALDGLVKENREG